MDTSSDDEYVVSEVHQELFKQTKNESSKIDLLDKHTFSTTLQISLPPNTLITDSDGDLVVPRREKHNSGNFTLKILHSIRTLVSKVGLQIWNGAFLLSDFIIFQRDLFDGKYVLELGAGCGVVGIVAGLFAKKVFLTDYSEQVLQNCKRNVEMNQRSHVAVVRKYDWTKSSETNFTNWEKEEVNKITIFLAADVIYDHDLTDAFVKTLQQILTPKSVLYLSVEKRFVFTLEHLKITSDYYDYFMQQLQKSGLERQQIDISRIPKFIHNYERNEQLELWKIYKKNEKHQIENLH